MLLTTLVFSALLCSVTMTENQNARVQTDERHARISSLSEDDGLQPADIVFINDASGSVGSNNFQKTLRFIENIVRGLVIGPYNAQIGSITFDTTVQLEFHLNTFSTKQDILNRVKTTKYTSGWTKTDLALNYAREKSFTRQHGMRTYAAQIAIVITDGDSNDKAATAAAAKRLRDEGITIFSIGVGDGPDLSELNAIASDPDSKHVFSVDSFDSLNKIKESLKKRAREAKPAFLCGGQADIVFLLENSDHVGQRNLDTMMHFVLGVVNDFKIGSDSVQVGVDTFSSGFSREFALSEHNNKYSLKAALASVRAQGGDTNTGEAIRMMWVNSFSSSTGHRPGVPKLAVVLTSGKSPDKELTAVESQKARDSGISVLAIGVGAHVDEEELGAIATGQGSHNVYTAVAFQALQSLQGYISSKLCDASKQEISVSPSADRACGTQADIVFMVDCSSRVENFKLLLDFIKTFVKELSVGQDTIRVAVAKFSSRPYNEFHLNRYNTTVGLLEGIDQIEHRKGGRDTAAAITYMDTSMFKVANGDRPGVPNIAVIMTDGPSTNPRETKVAATQARSHGITMFSLGIGNLTSRTELNDMATDADNRHVLAVTDFTKLNSLKTAFQGQICHEIPQILPSYQPPVTSRPTPEPDRCHDQISNCASYNKTVCSNFEVWARTNCAFTCAFCTPSTPAGTPTVALPCEDKLPDCPSYGISVCSGSSRTWGVENCRRYCGYCSSHALTVGQVHKCFYKGELYGQGDKWDDGCAYECECADASKGQYVCYNKCPSYFNLPKNCELQQKTGKCCLKPVCRFNETFTQKQVDALCEYNGQHYRQGQIWFVGCEFECICVDAGTGLYSCQGKCSKFDSLPDNCKLVRPPGECCEKPDCQFQTQVAKFTGSSGTRGTTTDKTFNTTCVDEISDCHAYQSELCTSAANRSFALDNCRKFCGLCKSESGTPMPDVCIYQGRSFQQGNTWYDGCEKTCVCDDPSTGGIRCEDRCPDYLNVPSGCTPVTVPGQCCRSLSCDSPATFTGSQTRNDTVGAVPDPVPSGQAQAREYPILPPGQTYAPGQNPGLITVATTSRGQTKSGDVGQALYSTLSPHHGSVRPENKTIVQPRLMCDPVEEGQSTTLTFTGSLENCPNLFKVKWQAQHREIASCTSTLCGSPYTRNHIFKATVYTSNSSLTISNVSRLSPFDMDTKWSCAVCGSREVLECDKLQVYALPVESECWASETTDSGNTSYVTVTCATRKVYPPAKCTFYTLKNNGSEVRVIESPEYHHRDTGESPVYYSSECSVSVSVQELGEGSHSFLGFSYPDVTGGQGLVAGITPNVTITLELPQASHSCSPGQVDGRFRENTTRCNCSLTSSGNPIGVPLWFQAGEPLALDTDELLVLTKDSHADLVFTCEAVSVLGMRFGSTLVANFVLEGPAPTVGLYVEQHHPLNTVVIVAVVVAVVMAVVAAVAAVVVYRVKRKPRPVGGLREFDAQSSVGDGYMFPMEKTFDKSAVDVTPVDGNEYETLPDRISTFNPRHTQQTEGTDKPEENDTAAVNDYETLSDVTSAVEAASGWERQMSTSGPTSAFVYDDGVSSDQYSSPSGTVDKVSRND